MKAETWQRMEAVVLPALELHGTERDEFIRQQCAGEPDLRRQVTSFVAILEDGGGSFLEGSRWRAAELSAPDDQASHGPFAAGHRIGPYRVEKLLETGGMGSVYRAERADGTFAKSVALKIVRPGRHTAEAEARFRLERRLLARLEHPHIARLYDAGETEDGLSYFVMEYIEGRPIDRYCDEEALDRSARLRLALKVCSAVQFAHRNLVLHRDIKPANILVDADGEPKLLDFGIGKLLSDPSQEQGDRLTATAQQLLTPSYASPEQVRGDAVTTATDVYALGVLLYVLFTGRRPFEDADNPLALARAIAEEEPIPPSRAIREHRLPAHELEGDLDAIILLALRKEQEQRYSSVERLADDLRRFQDGHPVLARQGNLLYRAGKLLRRHRVSAAALVLLVLATIGFVWSTLRQAEHTARERDRAQEVEAVLVDAFRQADPLTTGEVVSARQVLDRGAARISHELEDQPTTQATLLQAIGEAYLGLGEAEAAERLLRRARDTDAATLPPRRQVRLLASLSSSLEAMEEYEEAEALAREAMALAGGLPGAPLEEELVARAALANVLLTTQRMHQAEMLHLENLARLDDVSSASAQHRIDVLEGLAGAHLQQAEYNEGITRLRESLRIRDAMPGQQALGAAISRLKLAEIYLFRGEDAESRALFEASIPVLLEYLPRDHPLLISARAALANALTNLGVFEEAEMIYQDVIELGIQVHGEDSSSVATYRHNYAKIFSQRGDHEGAAALSRQAMEALDARYGADHGEVVMARSTHAYHLMMGGHLAESRTHLEEALAVARELPSPLHYGAGFPLETMGELLWRERKPTEAIEVYQEALTIWESAPNPHPKRAANAYGKIGRCLRELGRYEESEDHLLKAADMFQEIYPQGHTMRRGVRMGLIALYQLWEKPERHQEQAALLEAEGGPL